jgi:PleD family two-component response regulator
MKETEILIVGKNSDIMPVILRLLNKKPNWNGHTAFSADEAIEKSQDILFDLVLLGAGLTNAEAGQIHAHFTVPVVQHYGGGSGLLYAEVYQALNINRH